MKIHTVLSVMVIFFILGALAHAHELNADDFMEKIRAIMDVDFQQEDKLQPVIQEYVTSFGKIYGQIEEGVMDKEVLVEKLVALNQWLDVRLSYIFNKDQMTQWNKRKNDIYRDILTVPQ